MTEKSDPMTTATMFSFYAKGTQRKPQGTDYTSLPPLTTRQKIDLFAWRLNLEKINNSQYVTKW